jgi:DNA polymerase elongation subunit (family B)
MEVISLDLVGVTSENEYVYDLETEDGTYVAGSSILNDKSHVTGSSNSTNYNDKTREGILVKNTDSCYVKFDVDKSEFTKDGVFDEIAYMKKQFELAQECADKITKTFKKPIDLEFEKVMYPFFLYEKKRYAYQEWTDPNQPHNELEYKGVANVRRDYCLYVKEVCNNLFEILMKGTTQTVIDLDKTLKKEENKDTRNEEKIEEIKYHIKTFKNLEIMISEEKKREGKEENKIHEKGDVEGAIIYVKHAIKDLFDNKVDIEKLVISNALRDTYKVEGTDVKWTDNRINRPHVKLAQKLKGLDPVNHPKPPDRVPYLFIVVKGKAKLQWERVEHPDHLGKKKIDSLYYFDHQLKEPMSQIFDLMVEDTEKIYNELTREKLNKMNGQKQITSFFKITKPKKNNQIVLKVLSKKNKDIVESLIENETVEREDNTTTIGVN